ncbi:MAG: hypothetical protein ABIN99_06695, partial [Nitrosospira sp.]
MEPENEKETRVPPNMYLSPICNVLKNRKINGTFPELNPSWYVSGPGSSGFCRWSFQWPGLLEAGLELLTKESCHESRTQACTRA